MQCFYKPAACRVHFMKALHPNPCVELVSTILNIRHGQFRHFQALQILSPSNLDAFVLLQSFFLSVFSHIRKNAPASTTATLRSDRSLFLELFVFGHIPVAWAHSFSYLLHNSEWPCCRSLCPFCFRKKRIRKSACLGQIFA